MTDFEIVDKTLIKYHGKFSAIVNIPEGVEIIGKYAFHNNDSIKRVIFPKTVKVIDRDAFEGCSQLIYVRIPSTIEKICSEAFFWAVRLSEVVFYDYDGMVSPKDGVIEFASFFETSIERFEVPEGIKELKWAFHDSLKSIYLSSTVREFDDYALPDKLKEISVSKDNPCLAMDNNCLINIKNKTLIKSLLGDFPNNKTLKAIASRAFCAIKKPDQSFVIPKNYTIVKPFAFLYSSFKEIVFHPNVKDVKDPSPVNATKIVFQGHIDNPPSNFITTGSEVYFEKGFDGPINDNTFGHFTSIYINENVSRWSSYQSSNMKVDKVYMKDDNNEYVLVYETPKEEPKPVAKTPYNIGVEIYHDFSSSGDFLNQYLWLLDTQLLSACIITSEAREAFCNNLPHNISFYDRSVYTNIVKPKNTTNTFIDEYGWFIEQIAEKYPKLKDDIDNVFYKTPYITNKGIDLVVHPKRAIEYVELIIRLKSISYPNLKMHIEDDGPKAEKDFMKALIKFIKAEELFVRSAILVGAICGIFSKNEKDMKRWINVFKANNEWFFNEKIEKYTSLYDELRVEVNNYLDSKVANKENLSNLYKGVSELRRNAFKKYRQLGMSFYMNYLD